MSNELRLWYLYDAFALHLKLQAPVPICSNSMEKDQPAQFSHFLYFVLHRKSHSYKFCMNKWWQHFHSPYRKVTSKFKSRPAVSSFKFCNLSMTTHELRHFCTEPFTQWSVCKHDSAITLYQIHMCINSCLYLWIFFFKSTHTGETLWFKGDAFHRVNQISKGLAFRSFFPSNCGSSLKILKVDER